LKDKLILDFKFFSPKTTKKELMMFKENFFLLLFDDYNILISYDLYSLIKFSKIYVSS